jgi:predicted phage-related endonuclease
MICNVDGAIQIDGRMYILEVKTGSSYVKQEWTAGGVERIPDSYFCQVQHYLAAMDFPSQNLFTGGLIYGLIGNSRLPRFIDYSSEYADEIIYRSRQTWEIIERDNPLEFPIATADDLEHLKSWYPEHDGGPADLSELEDLISEYQSLGEIERATKKNRDEIKAQIIQAMRSNELAEAGEFMISLKDVVTRRIDSTIIKKELPDIYREYSKETKSSRLTVKKRK